MAEAEAAVSVNEKKWSVMHMHVQLKLDELRDPPNPWLTVTLKVPGLLLPFCWAVQHVKPANPQARQLLLLMGTILLN
jgi:hypothetical protein